MTAVYFKAKDPPNGLIGGDVISSKIRLDRIYMGVIINCACDHTLVDVLADILDGFEGAAQLYIHVGLEYLAQYLVVRNHPFIVDLDLWSLMNT